MDPHPDPDLKETSPDKHENRNSKEEADQLLNLNSAENLSNCSKAATDTDAHEIAIATSSSAHTETAIGSPKLNQPAINEGSDEINSYVSEIEVNQNPSQQTSISVPDTVLESSPGPPNKKRIKEPQMDHQNQQQQPLVETELVKKTSIADPAPENVALSMDHILEIIFSTLDIPTLRDCRLTCRRWKFFGAAEIQKRVTIILFSTSIIEETNLLNFLSEIHDLNDILHKDIIHVNIVSGIRRMLVPNPNPFYSLSNLQSIIETSDCFPCKMFEIRNCKLSSPKIQAFLSSCGKIFQKMCLSLNYEDQDGIPLQESTVLTDFKRILVSQAPNVESLDLRMRLPFEWEKKCKSSSSEFNLFEGALLLNLKSFTIRGSLLKGLFHEIMDSARNLESYVAYGDFCTLEEYFLEGPFGKDRVHLLKHLDFFLNLEGVEILEKLIKQHGPNLQLESIRFMSLHTFFNSESPSLWSRVSKVISKLLEGSSGTLKKLTLHPLKFIRECSIPRMEKLKTLTLYDLDSNLLVGPLGERYCPNGFSMESLFPVLDTVEFEFFLEINGCDDILFISEPLKCVKRVSVWNHTNISEGNRQVLLKFFPNAIIC